MTAHMLHPTRERRWLFAVVLLATALFVSACGSAPAPQGPAAVPGGRGGAAPAAREGAALADNVPVAAPTALAAQTDSVADADTVTYRVGQTAAVGDLRVTLDKAVVTAGEAGAQAEAGKHFLLVYITVENTGKTAQSLDYLSTSVIDMAGRRYFEEPYADYLSAAQPLGVSIPPAGRLSGNRGYMLPTHAGDLEWTVKDAGRNRATFAVATADLIALR